jgi:hypothetical protein
MQYKYIKGYGKRYRIYKDGKVQSMVGNTKWLKQQKHNGYVRVFLTKNCKTSAKFVHRLVAEAFIPNPNNFPVVNHIDWIRDNNRISNLEWVTREQNTIKKRPTPRDKEIKDRLKGILEMRIKGIRYEEIGNKYNISKQRVHAILVQYKKKCSNPIDVH